MSSDSSDPPAIVFDNGSHSFKAGLSLESTPSVILPTSARDSSDHETPYHSAYSALSLLDASSSHSVVVATESSTKYTQLAQTASLFFNSFQSPSLLFEKSPLLGLYAVGRTNGISVDSGHSKTRIVQVWQGFVMDYTATTVAKGGQAVTDTLRELFGKRIEGLDQEVLDDIKESCCFVNIEDGDSGEEKEYELPDGNVIRLGAEECADPAETLFQSDDSGMSVHEAVLQTINGKCDDDLRAGLYGQIVLSGGNTMLPGFASRLQKELESRTPTGTRVNIIASPARKHAVWTGGAIAGRDSAVMKHMAVTRAEYEETGDAIFRRKFIGYS